MSKTIMFIVMLICVIGVFCFGVMNASAISSGAENGAKLSQEARNHTHSYSNTKISYKYHQLKCECGATITANHKFIQIDIGQECIQ